MPVSKTRLILLVFLGLVLIGTGLSCIYRVAWSDIQRTDYTVYTAAGQALLDHTDLYEAQNARGWKYVYPPPFAILMIPFAKLPLAIGALIWYLLEIVAIAAVSWMSVSLLEPLVQERHKDLLYSLPLFSLCVILVSGAMRCQASIFMFSLMVAAFYFHFRSRPLAAGMSLAAAALLKVFPLVLVVYFGWKRQSKTLAATLAGLLLMGVLLPSLFWGWQQNGHHFERWVEVVAQPALMSNAERAAATPLYSQLMDTRKPRNQSLEALFLSAGADPEMTKRLVMGTGLAMLAVMLWASRRAQSRLDELALGSAFLAWSLLIPPISEGHYFGALILPLTILLGRVLYENHDKNYTSRSLIMFGGGFMLIVMLLLNWKHTEKLRPLCIATLAIWGALIYSIFKTKNANWPQGVS